MVTDKVHSLSFSFKHFMITHFHGLLSKIPDITHIAHIVQFFFITKFWALIIPFCFWNVFFNDGMGLCQRPECIMHPEYFLSLSDGVRLWVCHRHILLSCLLQASSSLSSEMEGGETQTCRPMDDLITEIKGRETIKDKENKRDDEMKARIAASLTELLIRSEQTTFWETPNVRRRHCGVHLFPSKLSVCLWLQTNFSTPVPQHIFMTFIEAKTQC